MNKEEIIKITNGMGFSLDLDQFDEDNWMRFQLKKRELDEKNFRWIWWKNDDLYFNLSNGARILFRAGQKAKMQQLNEYIHL